MPLASSHPNRPQALTWRNLFRLVVFLLGEELRSLAGSVDGYLRLSAFRVGTLVVLLVSVCALPTIAFDWGLSMFFPPHVDERDVEIAELVRAHSQASRTATH